jgi:hypothetical protein
VFSYRISLNETGSFFHHEIPRTDAFKSGHRS